MSKDDDKPRCTGKRADGKACGGRPLPGTTRCYHHSFKVPGRPSKLTAEIQDRIVDAVLEGNYLETAAQVVGINKTTLYRWLRRADELEAKALEHLTDDDLEAQGGDAIYNVTPIEEWVYLDFRHALKSAEAWAETETVRLLKALAVGGGKWQAAGYLLERRHPDRWRRREAHTLEHSGEVRRTVEVIVPTDQERAAVLARLQQVGAFDGVDIDTENTDQE